MIDSFFPAWILGRNIALFCLALGGLALPWLPVFRRWPPAERLALACGAALSMGYLVIFGAYASGAALRWFWIAPLAGAALGLFCARRDFAYLWADSTIRLILIGAASLTTWCLGWHMLIVTYSGAAWQVDWLEHYDRAHFFLAHWPRDTRLVEIYTLTARPPLVNLWAGALLSGSGGAFFNYQVFMTLLSCLVFLPLAALARRWRGDDRALPWLLVVLMTSPLLVQNATFPWTKLLAAFFVLIAWLQFTADDHAEVPARRIVGALALAAGMLAHYSAGPWICAIGIAWLVTRHRELRLPSTRRDLALGALLAATLLFTWIGWAAGEYGWRSTFADNTTISAAAEMTFAERGMRATANLFHTLWPFPGVGVAHPSIEQTSPAGRFRDTWFILYQLKLWWALGLTGGAVLCVALWLERPGKRALFAIVASVVVTVLGTATVSEADSLGLTHISLQPLVLLALGWMAARASAFPPWLTRIWIFGLAIDLALGIACHFGVQTGRIDSWLSGVSPDEIWQSYPVGVTQGFGNKVNLGLTFLADLTSPLWAAGILLFSTLLAIGVRRPALATKYSQAKSRSGPDA